MAGISPIGCITIFSQEVETKRRSKPASECESLLLVRPSSKLSGSVAGLFDEIKGAEKHFYLIWRALLIS